MMMRVLLLFVLFVCGQSDISNYGTIKDMNGTVIELIQRLPEEDRFEVHLDLDEVPIYYFTLLDDNQDSNLDGNELRFGFAAGKIKVVYISIKKKGPDCDG
jgi:hypothetical protein